MLLYLGGAAPLLLQAPAAPTAGALGVRREARRLRLACAQLLDSGGSAAVAVVAGQGSGNFANSINQYLSQNRAYAGNSGNSYYQSELDRIARQTKNQPRCPRADAWQHRCEHRSSRALRKSVEYRVCAHTLDHLRNVVMVTHGDAASQDHRVR